VFDRFFRGSNADRRSGTGLGLPVAAAHSGSLTVSSEGLGRGAVFTLALPLR
jgi:signal transduction histidine kinase